MLISFKLLSDNISKGVSLIQFNRKNIAKAINNAKKEIKTQYRIQKSNKYKEKNKILNESIHQSLRFISIQTLCTG